MFLLLTDPINGSLLVNEGLTTWYKHMIPALFPFMVLSGFLLRSNLAPVLSSIFNPVLGRIFNLSNDCIYIIVMGFLCGFPMGACVIAESMSLNRISKREAELLLAFCNNIGPVYFVSFVSVLCPFYSCWLTLSIMYGVPLLYGLILRYRYYRDIPFVNNKISGIKPHNISNYFEALQESVQRAIISIGMLGGYMIVFNVLQLPFYNSFYKITKKCLYLTKGLIEINSGISSVASCPDMYIYVYALFLPFCGLCCLFQTNAMIKDTTLSIGKYMGHKIRQTICTSVLYLLLKFL